MRRLARIAGLVIAALAVGIVAGRSVVPPKADFGRQAEIESGLDRPIASLHAQGTPLKKVLDSLVEQSRANIAVHWRVLEASGVDAQAPITLQLENVPLRAALDRVLREAGGQVVRLGYQTDDGVIDVSTQEDFSAFAVTRMYNVRDIVDAVVN